MKPFGTLTGASHHGRLSMVAFVALGLWAGHLGAGVPAEGIQFAKTFVTVSDSRSPTLQLVLLTGDDGLTLAGAEIDQLWCGTLFADRLSECLADRPDLADRIRPIAIAVGPADIILRHDPSEGEFGFQRRRAIVAICDSANRLLGWQVGVPTADELATMIEDAEEIDLILRSDQDPAERARQIVSRVKQREPRLYHASVQTLFESGTTPVPVDDPRSDEERQAETWEALRDLDDTFQFEVINRFGLKDGNAAERLIALEQHVQTRRPWCESSLVALAGTSFQCDWPMLVEGVWKLPPHRQLDGDRDGLPKSLARNDTHCFVIKPERGSPIQRWPPTATSTTRRTDWSEAHQRLMQLPHTRVGADELARWLSDQGAASVNLFTPSPARYLVVHGAKTRRRLIATWVVRQTDSPATVVRTVDRIKLSDDTIPPP